MDCGMCDKNSPYKDLLIKQFTHWRLELACNQVYLGKLLLILNTHREDLSELTPDEQKELFSLLRQTRSALTNLFQPDKFNYASLGNKDSHVHIHIIPRYKAERKFSGQTFIDSNWGGNYSPYNKTFSVDEEITKNLVGSLKSELSHSVDELAKRLWDYNLMHHSLKPADCIIVLGSHDLRVAERGAQLYLEGYAPLLVFSGGRGRLTNTLWDKPEAEMFADVAARMGVPKDIMLIENRSTNTGENIRFTKELLEKQHFAVNHAIIVTKPYMERRAFATARKVWPELAITMASPMITYDHYPNHVITKEHMINIMVGDTQRILEYPSKGYMVAQDIPKETKQAFEKLVDLGYTTDLLKL